MISSVAYFPSGITWSFLSDACYTASHKTRFAPLPPLSQPPALQPPIQICIPGILLLFDEFWEAPVLVLSPGVKQQLL